MATPSTIAGPRFDPPDHVSPESLLGVRHKTGRPRKVSPERAAMEAELLLREELARRMDERPLAYATLWDQPLPRTSQRRAACDLGEDASAIFGGNGSGKSELGAQLAVAAMLGRRHPDAVAWAAANAFPLDRLPDRPGRVLASGLTSNDSRRVQRAKVRAYLPPGCSWRNEEGDGEASVSHPDGGVIVFKSNDAGRRAYQGDWFDVAWLDEEHDEDVFLEVMMRVARVPGGRGHVVLTMTPLQGMTWVYDRFVANRPARYRAHWLHGTDNPHLPADKLAAVLAQYGPLQRAARERGEFSAMEGRVYADFSRELHVVKKPFPIPPEWPRFGAIDFGTRNPFAYLGAAQDPKDDTLYVYQEYLQAERPLSFHAAKIKELMARDGRPVEPGPDGGLRTEPVEPEWVVADPEDRGSRIALAREHGLYTVAAKKDVMAGISAVASRLAPDAAGKPHLFVFPECKHLVRELEGYVWTPGGGRNDAPERPLKKDDHAVDALRYLVFALDRVRDLV